MTGNIGCIFGEDELRTSLFYDEPKSIKPMVSNFGSDDYYIYIPPNGYTKMIRLHISRGSQFKSILVNKCIDRYGMFYAAYYCQELRFYTKGTGCRVPLLLKFIIKIIQTLSYNRPGTSFFLFDAFLSVSVSF